MQHTMIHIQSAGLQSVGIAVLALVALILHVEYWATTLGKEVRGEDGSMVAVLFDPAYSRLQRRGSWGLAYATVIAGAAAVHPIGPLRGPIPSAVAMLALFVLTIVAFSRPRAAAWLLLVAWAVLAVFLVRSIASPVQLGSIAKLVLPLPRTPGPLLHLWWLFRTVEPLPDDARLHQLAAIPGVPLMIWILTASLLGGL